MNQKNQSVLEDLLQEALRSVAITRRVSQDKLAFSNYRYRVITNRYRHNPTLLSDTFMYEPQLGDPRVREKILSFLRTELKQFLHEDRTYTATYAIFGWS